MSTINRKPNSIQTHEGATAKQISDYDQLRRSVMSCMLWEDSFYEEGEGIADRIAYLCQKVSPEKVKELALEAKYQMGIRHTPLWMAVTAKIFDQEFVAKLIRRVDDIMELLALYWHDGKKPIPKQMKRAFEKRLNEFDKYQLAKYRGLARDIKLRDIIRLIHPKPVDDNHSRWFKEVIDNTITPPDTWETALMQGANKKETFERLISEQKLGALAFLRNLRNMRQSGVSNIGEGLKALKCSKILPFQFIKAAQFAPEYEDLIEEKMLESMASFDKLKGHTVLLVDVSASMRDTLSGKSEINRSDAAAGVAIMAREMCEKVSIFAFGSNVYEIPNRRGFALSDLLGWRSEGTFLGDAIDRINTLSYDRIIVITDEQSHDSVADPKTLGYMINVAPYQNGVGYYAWHHIDGWSPSVMKYIVEAER